MKPIVFALPGNETFAQQLATALEADTGETTIRNFPDGETYVRVLTDVSGREVILVCTLDHPDGKLLPLYFLSHTLKSLGAKCTCIVAPYLAYMRQDKVFHPGEGITSAYFAKLISGFAERLFTIDPHLHRRTSMAEIYSVPCMVLHASTLISDYIRDHIGNPLLIGPDSESEQWVSQVAKDANAPYIVLEKVRKGDTEVNVTVPQVEKYKDHTPVLVDDIISTARTMIETVNHLKKAGMKPPVCIGVHAVFAGNAYEELQNAGVDSIITCNTIAHASNALDVTALMAASLNKIFLS